MPVHHAAPVVSSTEVRASNTTPKPRKSRSDRKSRTSVTPSESIPEEVNKIALTEESDVNPFIQTIPEIVDTDPLATKKDNLAVDPVNEF